MARKKAKARSYFEPWQTTKSRSHGDCPFPEGVPDTLPEGVGENLIEAWHRSDKSASWIVWGSGMTEPGICHSLMGGITYSDDKRIICDVHRKLGLEKGTPTQEELARRMCECVTAMAGIADPQSFVDDVRSMLLRYANGECEDPRSDVQAISLLGRCIPLEQLERCGHEVES